MLKVPENLDVLLKERNAHEGLASAQLKSLLLRQKQLQALEQQLKMMEGQTTKLESAPEQSAILNHKQKQLEQFEQQLAMLENSFNDQDLGQPDQVESITTDNYANSIMSNFPADLQVQKQTYEKLSYLEEQLAQLKELKAQMIEGAEIMEKKHNQVKEIHDIAENVQVVNIPKNNSSVDGLSRSELEVATEAMLGYLNMKEQNEEGENLDEELILQQLMQRLMASSVDKNELMGPVDIQNDQTQDDQMESENKDQHEYQRLLDEEEELESEEGEEDPLKGEEALSEIIATSERIDLAIDGLNHQINQVKQSEDLITTEKERVYYKDVLGKLELQMNELVEIRTKIDYYKELMNQNQEVLLLVIFRFVNLNKK
jgi:hypothetical protein